MIQIGTVEKGPRGLRRSRVVAREKAVLRCLNVIGGQGGGVGVRVRDADCRLPCRPLIPDRSVLI